MRAPDDNAARVWSAGDRATWSYVASGYAFTVPVAAIVREVHKSRVLIEVAQRQQGQWVRVLKLVPPNKLAPRTVPVAELGEVTRGEAQVSPPEIPAGLAPHLSEEEGATDI